MDRTVFLSILAMDAYQHGYAQGIDHVEGTSIGTATISGSSLTTFPDSKNFGFFAAQYEWNGETVISYRGTDFDVGAGGKTFSLISAFYEPEGRRYRGCPNDYRSWSCRWPWRILVQE